MAHTLPAKKSLGQNFLNNPAIPRAMADAADISASDVVLEIGPGTGVLTTELCARAGKVIAIEADQRAVTLLKERFAHEIALEKLTVVSGDVRMLNLATLGLGPREYKVVANIPYYLSGFLFRTFLESDIQPSCLVFLVQKEVAERIARDEKESLLSLSIRAYGTPSYIQTVKKGNFTPQPKIDSAIIAVRDISKENFKNVSEKAFFELIHHGFKSKRKQLLGNLSAVYVRTVLEESLTTLGLPLKVRGEDVRLATWLQLVRLLEMHKESEKNTLS